ncbi:putative glutaminase GtaA [Rhizoctonia solani 123E]|uniref:Putative glutaminase GtaA n=1 Tax=Rhizoctonia solani 123E TaxID=1423351 RepID=A0A074S9F5_9AGAM|nr:putative glutaminase GtaA [Rhizoctonia solani 123E]
MWDARSTFGLAMLGLFSGSLVTVAKAQNVTWQSTPFNPPMFPLSIKSPYTSAWTAGATNEPARHWPYFGTGATLGWLCLVKVDNTTYNVLGDPIAPNITTETQTEFTPTRTIISSRAGPVNLVVTFLSAIDASDLVRLSLPFSYFTVSAVSNDGASHSVSVYTDNSGEFVTSDTSLKVQWSTTTEGIIVHQMSLQDPITYSENKQRAQWGTAYLAANQTDGTTWQTGIADSLRKQFIQSGKLSNTPDQNFREVSKDWPVMAIAQSLGTVATQAQTASFVLGHSRNPAVEYYTSDGKEDRSLYFLSKFSSEEDAVRYTVTDYTNALAASTEFDNKVQTDATKYSPDYASVVALSTRQAFASMEITLSGTGSGANLQDIKLFTKDAAVDDTGASREGVLSAVDSLYSMMPMLIYTNPNLGNYGLASLLEYAGVSGVQSFAVHDLGLRYPRVASHAQQSRNPLDATANMIIMTHAFMRYTGNAGLAAKHYYTLKTWADYLVANAVIHEAQLTGDWFMTTPAANQTNLALKALIALKSIVEIQKAVGMTNESSTYENAANSGLERWMQLSSSGTKYTYQSNSQQPQLLHGLYADKLLGLSFVPESVYAQQRTQWTAGMKSFGVALNGESTTTSTAWQYFTLAALTTSDTSLLSNSSFTPIKNFVIRTQSDPKVIAPADVYDATTGNAIQGYGLRGNVGGSYALLALSAPTKTITEVPASPSPPAPTTTAPGASSSNSNSALGGITSRNMFSILATMVLCFLTLLLI